jgi:hypothetical protein
MSNRYNNHNNNNNIRINAPIMLMVGISCNVFDSYQNISVSLDPAFVHEIINMESDVGMKVLSKHICTRVICTVYDDLFARGDHGKIRQLLQKVQEFHIHGRTARDIIFPSNDDDPHAHHGRYVYVCTHC